MSLYKPATSSIWWCDFRIDGQRFRYTTGETERRAAQAAERRLKNEVRARRIVDQARRAEWGGKEPPTMGYVVARYWAEVGQHHAAPRTTWWSLE